jgi:hypothetical protein
VEGCHVCRLDKAGVDGGSGGSDGSGVAILEDGPLGVDAPPSSKISTSGPKGMLKDFSFGLVAVRGWKGMSALLVMAWML